MGLTIRIREGFCVALVCAKNLIAANTTLCFVSGVVNLCKAVFNDDAKIAAFDGYILAIARSDQMNVTAVLWRYADRDHQFAIDHCAGVFVRAHNELVSCVRHAVAKVFPDLGVQEVVCEPLFALEYGVKPFVLFWYILRRHFAGTLLLRRGFKTQIASVLLNKSDKSKLLNVTNGVFVYPITM